MPASTPPTCLILTVGTGTQGKYSNLAQGLINTVGMTRPELSIIVNPTSGTKQMSAGATLAALDEGVSGIAFTIGERADGVVKTGTETITPFDSGRWRAEKEASLAANLWDRNLHAAAAAVLRGAARYLQPTDPVRTRLLAPLVADPLAHKEAFQFSQAAEHFRTARRELRADDYPVDTPLHRLSRACDDLRKRMEHLASAQGGVRKTSLQKELLSEIIANSLRCAVSRRFEDAACRLYRAIEMALQIRLAEKTDGAYWNGSLTKGRQPPPALCSAWFLAVIRRPELPHEFSMEHLARALHALGDESVLPLCEDLDKVRKSDFRAATSNRNASILAHGVAPVDQAGFEALKTVASRFLSLVITQTHPLPSFDPAWLREIV